MPPSPFVINVKSKSIALSSDNLRHIFSEHGNAKTENDRGQISITTKNIEDIVETIIETDKVSKEINRDGSVSVLFEKKLNGRNLAITVLSNKKNTLTLKSARIFKNSISSSSDAKAPLSTSETLGGMNDSSTTIIRNNSKKSTENAKKDEKRFSSRASIDVDSKNRKRYNSDKGGTINGRKENRNRKQGSSTEEVQRENRGGDRRGSNAIFVDGGRTRRISEITRDEETVRKIECFAQEVYATAKTERQENLQWHAKNEEVNLYFAKRNADTGDFYIFEKDTLIIDENATEKQFVDILNIEKPIMRNVDNSKSAKISEERWNKFLSHYPNAYFNKWGRGRFVISLSLNFKT